MTPYNHHEENAAKRREEEQYLFILFYFFFKSEQIRKNLAVNKNKIQADSVCQNKMY
jgi:hypothetical protein